LEDARLSGAKKKNEVRHGQFSEEEKGEWSGRTHALKGIPTRSGQQPGPK
jgi:hypothetical protein